MLFCNDVHHLMSKKIRKNAFPWLVLFDYYESTLILICADSCFYTEVAMNDYYVMDINTLFQYPGCIHLGEFRDEYLVRKITLR